MSKHKCKVAFKCGEHAVYEEITEECPYCRIAELEAQSERPAVTDEPPITLRQAEKAIELWNGEYVGQDAAELWKWAYSAALTPSTEG